MSRLYRILISFWLVVGFFLQMTTLPALAAAIPIAQTSAKDFLKLGVKKITAEDLKQASVNFTQAIELDSELAAAYSNRCLVYIELGKYEQAAMDCTQALQLNPKNAESYLNRGLAYYRQGHYLDAIADYNQTIKLNPADYRAYYNRGLAYFEQKDYEQALSDYNRALHYTQRDNQAISSIYNDRGLAYF